MEGTTLFPNLRRWIDGQISEKEHERQPKVRHLGGMTNIAHLRWQRRELEEARKFEATQLSA